MKGALWNAKRDKPTVFVQYMVRLSVQTQTPCPIFKRQNRDLSDKVNIGLKWDPMVVFVLLFSLACTKDFSASIEVEEENSVTAKLPVDLMLTEFDGTKALHFGAGDWKVDNILDFQSPSVSAVSSLTWHDGLFYISPRQPQKNITITQPNGTALAVLEHPYLEEPVKVLLDDENIYILCNDSGLVLVFDKSSHEFKRDFGWDDNQQIIRYPHDMVWGPNQNLYIITENTNQGFIQEWTKQGEFLGGFGQSSDDAPWIPSAITFNKTGEILVTDYWNQLIHIFDDEDRSYLGEFASLPEAGSYPENMKLGLDSHLYVSSGEKIHIFDETGDLLSVIGGHLEHIGSMEFVH